jgi:POT family proton-dependent oligopeptide transporter
MLEAAPVKKSLYQRYTDIMPTGAGALFFIQMFSTLSFSVLYSTLVLYTTNWLHLSDTVATSITASFVAFNYTLHLLGGFAGGRLLSYRSLFSVGMLCSLVGCVLISVPNTDFLYWGLAAFLTGSGLNVTCINCMLTQLFQPNDKRREAAFLWNYSGMNVGFFVGFTVSGYYQLQHGYHELFLLSSLGNLIALIITACKWKSLRDINTTFIDLASSERALANFKGVSLVLILILALRWLLEHAHFSNSLIMCIGITMGIIIAVSAFKQSHTEARNKMLAFIVLAMTALIFWTLYQLAPMGLTLFIERNVDRHYLGMIVPPQWVQNINTIVIILGGPILSVAFSRLREKGVNLSISLQFAFALVMIGVGFAILPLGIYFADAGGYSNFNWIIASFIFQSLGELFISPIGYAMVGQLAPMRMQGMMMGTWLMITGVAATLSNYFSKMALGAEHATNPMLTNPSFSHTFSLLGWTSIAAGLLLFACLPLMARLTHEKDMHIHHRASVTAA